MIAQYRCTCGHTWEKKVEGGTPPLKHGHSDHCPACGSAYFEWSNHGKPDGETAALR